MKLESIVQYLDGYLGVEGHPDFPGAFNGLQVEADTEVGHVVAAVDASEAAIRDGIGRGAQLILVHHGLFWDGPRPLTGRLLRRVRPLIEAGVALYSSHLPLDAHAEVGNAALLARALDLTLDQRFGTYQGVQVGWSGRLESPLEPKGLVERVEQAVGGSVRLLDGGPSVVERVAVVTGSGGSLVAEAARLGIDALVTGELSHHTYFEASELGIHVVAGGHYATETFGVRALAEHLSDRFGLTWDFVDHPTGL